MTLKNIDVVACDQKTDKFLNFSNRILYRDAIRYLDYNNILGFFVRENRNYSIIGSLLADYRDIVAKQLQDEKDHLTSINMEEFKFKSEASKNYVIDKTKESINHLMEDMMNMDYLIFLCDKLAINNKDLQLEKKYIERIHRFINYRLNTKKDGHTVINETGLLSLAMDINDCSETGVMDYVPKIPSKFYKKMEYYISLINYYIESASMPRFNRSKDGSDEDPDNFMYLSEEDYHSLLTEDFNSSLARESVQNQIDNLTERKEKRF